MRILYDYIGSGFKEVGKKPMKKHACRIITGKKSQKKKKIHQSKKKNLIGITSSIYH